MSIFFCPACSARVQLVPVGAYNYTEEGQLTVRVEFGHCALCRSPAVLEFAEMDEGYYELLKQLYPSTEHRIEASLPTRVAESYVEATKCASAGAPLATAVMVRRTLEAIALEIDPSAKKGLFAGLARMKELGTISDELYQWGEALRFLGNISAHPTGEIVTSQEAQEAIEFLTAIVQTMYVLRPKFEAMRARRAANGARSVQLSAANKAHQDASGTQ